METSLMTKKDQEKLFFGYPLGRNKCLIKGDYIAIKNIHVIMESGVGHAYHYENVYYTILHLDDVQFMSDMLFRVKNDRSISHLEYADQNGKLSDLHELTKKEYPTFEYFGLTETIH